MIGFAFALALLTVADPAPGPSGVASLTAPTGAMYRSLTPFDIQEAVVLDGETVSLRLRLGSYANPFELELGFSHPIIEIYVGGGEHGREELLPGSGMVLPDGELWNVALRITGDRAWGFEATADEVREFEPEVTLDGTYLYITTDIPAIPHPRLSAITGLYSAFHATGWRPLELEPSAWAFSSQEQLFPVVDVLALDEDAQLLALRTGTLPVTEVDTIENPNTLWLVLMAAGIAVAGVGLLMRTSAGRRRAAEAVPVPATAAAVAGEAAATAGDAAESADGTAGDVDAPVAAPVVASAAASTAAALVAADRRSRSGTEVPAEVAADTAALATEDADGTEEGGAPVEDAPVEDAPVEAVTALPDGPAAAEASAPAPVAAAAAVDDDDEADEVATIKVGYFRGASREEVENARRRLQQQVREAQAEAQNGADPVIRVVPEVEAEPAVEPASETDAHPEIEAAPVVEEVPAPEAVAEPETDSEPGADIPAPAPAPRSGEPVATVLAAAEKLGNGNGETSVEDLQAALDDLATYLGGVEPAPPDDYEDDIAASGAKPDAADEDDGASADGAGVDAEPPEDGPQA